MSVVEASRQPFDASHSTLLARGAYTHGDEVVIENACSAGFDLHLHYTRARAEFAFAGAPPLVTGSRPECCGRVFTCSPVRC